MSRKIKQKNLENKSYQSILGDPETVFEPNPNPKDSPLGPQKSKMTPKLSQNQMSELKEIQAIVEF